MLVIVLVLILISWIFFKLTKGTCRSSTCLLGKTAIVTGANSGIGYNTVLNLASRGCRVIMADVVNMDESQATAIKCTNNCNIVAKHVDLSSLESVRKFASEIVETENRLDILINNAGIGVSEEDSTSDGLHPVMQVNYFGHFLLTHLLTDLLKKSSPSRIIFTSSFMAFLHYSRLANLNGFKNNKNIFSRAFLYCNSKYALLIASDIFAEKLRKFGVTSNSVNPGFTRTGMLPTFWTIHKNCLLETITYFFQCICSRDAWEGSQVLVHVATSKELEGVTGEHFWDCRPFLKPLGAADRAFCGSIWRASEKLVGLQAQEML